MRYLLLLLAPTFFGLVANAVPPAGSISYEDGLKQSASYNEVCCPGSFVTKSEII